jgi:dynein heavy chain
MFPAIVNCTTIDWYSEWPQDALLEVAEKYIQEVSLGSEKQVSFVRFSKNLPGIL